MVIRNKGKLERRKMLDRFSQNEIISLYMRAVALHGRNKETKFIMEYYEEKYGIELGESEIEIYEQTRI